MRLLNADSVQFFAWNRENETCEKRRKFDVCKRIRRTYPRFAEKQGITQKQLSIMLNVSANHLAKVETGSRCCSIELLQDLSSCLNVRTDYLLNGDAPHNNHLRERLTFLAQELEKITADLPVWG